MAYTVFARKYRPQTFEELVGQEHVARTLRSAIESERVAHAFLFTGVRGVGKTTTARLLAKALNCETGPTPTPCNECAQCRDITTGVDIDVQEIDGASNNSVDDVRRLQESLPFRPARDRFKIVIVDEVHMLSSGAFNAFLKTLEEPPEHVKFIFATTEAHKVPVTIRSRCQRYDFRLIKQAVIGEAVRKILDSEEVKADDEAVAIVAREAGGSMRDALTLLDQLVAFGGAELAGEQVSRHLGIATRGAIHSAATALLDGDPKRILEEIQSVVAQGADPLHFTRQLLQLLRDLVVLRVTEETTSLVDMVAEERSGARALCGAHDPLELQRVFASVAKLVDDVARAGSPRLVLEMGLVRVATRPKLRDVSELLARVERLEKSFGGGGGSRGGAPRGGPGAGGGPGGSTSSAAASAPAAVARPRQAERHAPSPSDALRGAPAVHERRREPTEARRPDAARRGDVSRAEVGARGEGAEARRPDGEGRPEPGADGRRRDGEGRPAEARRRDEGPGAEGRRADARRSGGTEARRPGGTEARRPGGAETRRPGGTEARRPGGTEARRPGVGEARRPGGAEARRPGGTEAASRARGHAPSIERSEPSLRRAAILEWEAIVKALEAAKPALAAVLQHGVPRVVSAERVVISFQPGSFYGRQAETREAKESVLEVAEARWGRRPALQIRYDADPTKERTVAAVEESRRKAEVEKRRRDALKHPAVQDAMDVFPESRGHVEVRLENE